jgi:hypothetical protein
MKISNIILLICFVSTSSIAQNKLSMTWLAGTWKIDTGRGFIVEKWKSVNDSTLTGRSFFVKAQGDSVLQESLELSLRKGQWTFTSTVQGQNNNQPVSFRVIFARGTEFISENPEHDFPQRIAYRRVKNNLFASIEGRKNGKFGKQNFDFTGE